MLKHYFLILKACYVLILCGYLVSCQENQKREIGNKKNSLVILDSINIDLDSIKINNYNFDLYQKEGILMALGKDNQVYFFDNTGKILKKFGRLGKAPNEYLTPVGLFAINKDSIFLSDLGSRKIFLYNSDAKVLKALDVHRFDTLNTQPTFYNYLQAYYKENNLVIEYAGYSSKKHYLTTPAYYPNARILSCFNTANKQFTYHFPYEQDSPYLKNQYMLSPFGAHIVRYAQGYAVTFPHEYRLFLYDLNKKLVRTIDVAHKYFNKNPEGISFEVKDKNFGQNYVKYSIKKNAIKGSLVTYNKMNKQYFIQQYEKALGEDVDFPDDINYWRMHYIKRPNYINIVDEQGKEVLSDTEISEKLGILQYAKDEKFMLFASNNRLTEKNILYVAKLVKE